MWGTDSKKDRHGQGAMEDFEVKVRGGHKRLTYEIIRIVSTDDMVDTPEHAGREQFAAAPYCRAAHDRSYNVAVTHVQLCYDGMKAKYF
jgi:hypothetical protein